MRRHFWLGFGIGVAACLLYATVAVFTYGASGPVRPLYEGPCPPTTCPPCPPTCPTYAPYTPPPESTPSNNPPPPPPAPKPTSASGPNAGPSPAPSAGSATATPSPGAGPVPPPVAGLIGPGGGSATASDGQLEVIVPPGALSSWAVFVVKALSPAPPLPGGRPAATAVWDVSATSGGVPLTVFDRPLQLVFHYQQAVPLVIATWDGQEWVNVSTTVDRGRRTATAFVPHLTPVVAFTAATQPFIPLPLQAALPVIAIVVLCLGLLIIAITTAYVRTGQRTR